MPLSNYSQLTACARFFLCSCLLSHLHPLVLFVSSASPLTFTMLKSFRFVLHKQIQTTKNNKTRAKLLQLFILCGLGNIMRIKRKPGECKKITLKTGKITKKLNFGYSIAVRVCVCVSERNCMSSKVFRRVVCLRYKNNNFLYICSCVDKLLRKH